MYVETASFLDVCTKIYSFLEFLSKHSSCSSREAARNPSVKAHNNHVTATETQHQQFPAGPCTQGQWTVKESWDTTGFTNPFWKRLLCSARIFTSQEHLSHLFSKQEHILRTSKTTVRTVFTADAPRLRIK